MPLETAARKRVNVFISYSHADRKQASAVVEVLRSRGLAVWWDEEIPTGHDWRERLRSELEASSLIIVLWSEVSVVSDNVKHEASIGMQRGVLLPARLSPCVVPGTFSAPQIADLFDDVGGLDVVKLSCFASTVAARIRAIEVGQLRRRWLVVAAALFGALAFGYFWPPPLGVEVRALEAKVEAPLASAPAVKVREPEAAPAPEPDASATSARGRDTAAAGKPGRGAQPSSNRRASPATQRQRVEPPANDGVMLPE